MTPAPPAERTTEQRLAELEEFIAGVLARARAHPVGRKVLAVLGLS